jgi:poly-gamma-glutamate capsule biosynthesis protein CapA/YwtB (metallophosphatase superfamily)
MALMLLAALALVGCAPSEGTSPPPTTAAEQGDAVEMPAPSSSPTNSTPQPSATATDEPPPIVRLAFAGDSYAEGPLAARLANNPKTFVGPFAPVLQRADVAMVNLETAIATSGTPEPKAYNFAAPPSILPALASGGIDVVSMANNHGMDYGWEGFEQSLRAKRQVAEPAVIGIGRDQRRAYAPWIAEVRGQRIAFFTASQVLDPHLEYKWTAGLNKGGLASAFRVDYLTKRIEQTRPNVDTIVVYLHWGIEKTTCPIDYQTDLTKALKKAGADVVVGGGQHRISGGGFMGKTLVHYGLGNFLFQAASSGSDRTGVLTVAVRGRDVVNYRWRPGLISAGVPQKLTGATKRAELSYWESLRGCANLKR